MQELTFGFMDPSRGAVVNSELFIRTRSLAIKRFSYEKICNLESFADDSIDDSHEILAKGIGREMGEMRDHYYETLSQRNVPIRFPDIQSFFLYSFTSGINLSSFLLMDPRDIPSFSQISSADILKRNFPIRGPAWLCNAINVEIPFVENVFCDFQDEILMPIFQKSPVDDRFAADAIAGAMLWAFFGGTFWLKECVMEVCESFFRLNKDMASSEKAMYQVKKTTQLISKKDIDRALANYDTYKNLT